MKYRLIKIDKNPINGKFSAYVGNDPTERENAETRPHGLGFYYSPETETVEEGFNKLKNLHIEALKKKVIELQKTIVELRKLRLK